MKAFLLLACSALFLAPVAHAAALNDEQVQTYSHLVDSVLSGLREDGHFDTLLRSLDDAYARSAYGKEAGVRDVVRRLRADAVRLRGQIDQLEKDIAAERRRQRDPAVMTWMLSRAQSVSFGVYSWTRSMGAMTSMANLSANRDDAAANELLGLMIKEGEAQQDTLGTAIQVLASRFLVTAPVAASAPTP